MNMFELMQKMNSITKKAEETNTSKKANKSRKSAKKIKIDYSKLINNEVNLFDEITNFFTSFSIENSKKVLENAVIKVAELFDFVGKGNLKTPSSNEEKIKNNLNAIRKATELEHSNSLATIKDQEVLSKYLGWGGLSKGLILNQELIEKAIGKEAFDTAKSSVTTSFYTPSNVVKFMWNVLKKMGFEKGKILEPSAGIGNIFKFMNEQNYFESKVTCIEMDKITSIIAKNLLQSSNVINDRYENISSDKLKDNSFDLVISNIPFGNFSVYDPETKEGNYIHDFYFLKSLRKVRENGLIAFVTSTGIMDRNSSKLREFIDEKATFLGAVRLPNGVFSETSVAADIIFLQKKSLDKDIEVAAEDENLSDESKQDIIVNNNSWINTVRYCEEEVLYINEYFYNNPQMIMGDTIIGTNQYGKTLLFKSNKELKSSDFKKMEKYFAYDIYTTPLDDSYMFKDDELIKVTNDNVKQEEFTVINKQVYQRQGFNFIPLTYTGERLSKVLLYIEIKEVAQTIIKEQLDGCTDEKLVEIQSELNRLYDEFVSKYGFINNRNNRILLNKCIMYTFVSSLEDFDKKNKTYIKTDIFTKRTIGQEINVIPENMDDAIVISLSQYGYINLTFISKSLKRDIESITDELLEKEICYLSHDGSSLIYCDEYLSGNVVEKLEDAEQLGPIYERNVLALKAVQPEYITDVVFSINSTWIPIEIKRNFIAETLNLQKNALELDYTPLTGYVFKCNTYISSNLNLIWGTSRVNIEPMLKKVLNLGDLTVYDTVDKKRVKNAEETQLAINIANKWKLEFNDYINNNSTILADLIKIYNRKFNCFVDRNWKNIFHNINHNKNITLREHQLNAITRGVLDSNNTLLFHSVGTGKSFTMFSIAELNHKLGIKINKETAEKLDGITDRFNFKNNAEDSRIVGKTLLIAPNTLCKSNDLAKEYLRLYPQAKLLATSPDDFKRDNRRRLINKIAFGDWSCVIMPMSVLGLIPLSPEIEKALLDADLKEIDDSINYLSRNTDNSYTLKDLEAKRANYIARINELNHQHKDRNTLYFEQLGFTNIICDEFHNWKGLSLNKTINVSGSNISPSKRAQDLYNKIRYHQSIFGEGKFVAATATPISNSLAEMYVLFKFLLKRRSLMDLDLITFDAFVANFAEVVSQIEIDPTGTSFRLKSRLGRYSNVPELIKIFRQFADVVNIGDIADIDIPKRFGGGIEVETIEITDEMKAYIDDLVERAKKISDGSVKPNIDNFLKVTTDGRKLALSPKLVGIPQKSPKLTRVAERIFEIYQENKNATQIVFCSLGTPNNEGKYCSYDELKENLIEKGMNPSDIRYMQEANTTKKREELISDFNNGIFKVLIGSDSLMSEGLNIQKLAIASHNVDIPWKPATIEQRSGRTFRSGNVWKEAHDIKYVCKGSFDAYSYQLVEMKAKYINQILMSTSSDRVSEDLENATLSYEECKACASSNPKILELANLRRNLTDLKVLERAYKKQMLETINNKESAKIRVERIDIQLGLLESDLKSLSNNHDLILDGINIIEEEDGIKTLASLMQRFSFSKYGSIGGLNIELLNTMGKCILIGQSQTKINWKIRPKSLYKDIINIESKMLEKFNALTEDKEYYSRLYKELSSVEFPVFKDSDKILSLEKEIKSIEAELSV